MATPTDTPTPPTADTTPAAPAAAPGGPVPATICEQLPGGYVIGFPAAAGASGPLASIPFAWLGITPGANPNGIALTLTAIGKNSAAAAVYVHTLGDEEIVLGILNPPADDSLIIATLRTA